MENKNLMGKMLVIVESPAKAKTINSYLGSDYVVKSSVGHIRDLPPSSSGPLNGEKRQYLKTLSSEEKAKYQLVRRMGIDPDDQWKADYQVLPGKEKVVEELKRLAKRSETIYLATDRDREGEAIAWHLMQTIGGDPERFRRVVFSEITQNAIKKAFSNPMTVNEDRVNAQQARRFLDRVVGYMVSPLLWKKIARGLSAGRVQSVAVRLVVEKERSIKVFVPEEYWEIFAKLRSSEGELVTQIIEYDDKPFRPSNALQTQEAIKALEKTAYKVISREDKQGKTKPPAPFITSTMQQAASQQLGFPVRKTMTLAQRLYESGLITYMRTDSPVISNDAVFQVRNWIQANFPSEYLPEKPNFFTSKTDAQEAHEAIRPTSVELGIDYLNRLDVDAKKLYKLIRQQFIACQMTPTRYLTTTIRVKADRFLARARGRVTIFEGFQIALSNSKKSLEATELPSVTVNQILQLLELDPKQKFTAPPPRFNEASLVREMEKRGIGRPSTYAAIISTIQERGYVNVLSRRLFATKMGEIVTDRLVENFRELMNYDFTAGMENSLDHIATGRTNWLSLLNDFYKSFKSQLHHAEGTDGMRPNNPTETDIVCPACSRNMTIRTATTGVFLGCSGYNVPVKERCKTTINLLSGEEVVNEGEEGEIRHLLDKERCGLCETAMECYLIDSERKLHICGNNPDCNGFKVEIGKFRIKGYDGPVIDCDKCGQKMQLKTGRFGKFFGCSSEDCKNTRKLLKNGKPAPPKMDPIPMPWLPCLKVDDTYVLRDGATGLFLAASQFPKKRETRAPTVSELKSVEKYLEKKYKFLISAPETDPEGLPSQVRYSRKTGSQFVTSESNGKMTNWKISFIDGAWKNIK